jgi:hypothetical protein
LLPKTDEAIFQSNFSLKFSHEKEYILHNEGFIEFDISTLHRKFDETIRRFWWLKTIEPRQGRHGRSYFVQSSRSWNRNGGVRCALMESAAQFPSISGQRIKVIRVFYHWLPQIPLVYLCDEEDYQTEKPESFSLLLPLA